MDITSHICDGKIRIKVHTNSSMCKIEKVCNELHMYVQSRPEKNKANTEIINFFKKNYNLDVKIISGSKCKKKILFIT